MITFETAKAIECVLVIKDMLKQRDRRGGRHLLIVIVLAPVAPIADALHHSPVEARPLACNRDADPFHITANCGRVECLEFAFECGVVNQLFAA